MSRERKVRPTRRYPGPVYDVAIRCVLEGNPVAACRLLGIPVTTANGVPEALSASFAEPRGSYHADLLMRIGPGRLAHVEYERYLSAEDMVARMLIYRGVIQRRHLRERLLQYLVVLGSGQVHQFIDPILTWFWRRLGVVFLRDLDREPLLADPALAALAVLGREGPTDRAGAFRRALTVIWSDGGDRTTELWDSAISLARLTLDESTIDQIVKEVEMNVQDRKLLREHVAEILWDGSLAKEIREGWREEAIQEGMEKGMEKGMENGREGLLVTLLETRFGPQPVVSEVAHRLVADLDDAAALHLIFNAATIADLVNRPELPV